MIAAYYNENDPFPAQWLRNLIYAGHLPSGAVDERSISDLKPEDITCETAHFFSGIGGWPYALKLAGWPDDAPVWTGSCPCQPFSAAGKRRGDSDERHLWPVWFNLIRKHRPPVVFGEQVASADGLRWFDAVCADLESEGYAVGGADLCAAGVGAPHLRQRLYWVAYAAGERRDRVGLQLQQGRQNEASSEIGGGGEVIDRMGDSDSSRLARRRGEPGNHGSELAAPQRASSFWDNPDWVDCRDGKQRPTQRGLQPISYGLSSRMERRRANGQLKGYGNAIVPQVAAKFVRVFMDSVGIPCAMPDAG